MAGPMLVGEHVSWELKFLSAECVHRTYSGHMADLPFQIERYIVKQLACDEAPETIVEDVQGQFLRTVTPDQVRDYHPDHDGSALTAELQGLYQRTRQDFLSGTEEESVFVEVATTEALDDGTVHCVEEAGTAIALIAREDGYSALANRCTHKGGPLCEGELSDETIECPWHGAEFDVETGSAVNPPAPEGVETYEVRVQGDAIEVKL